MTMNQNKTVPTDASVIDFIINIDNPTKKADAHTLLTLMAELSGETATMWGSSIIGFGQYHYKYDSGREGDFLLTGFSPRKQNFSLYIMSGFSQYDELLAQLGKHKTGKSCLYINKLADVDIEVLKQLISLSLDYMRERYSTV
ncbi:DUF1801 domain-containing protein [Flocculibacter collagenilyticus]|uniref:DUF1801 domain-containing protein n=1 Tax=Flocculibacter collagenilyticus TaxID=2744479 RepID=UPI001F3EF045|nr:DUF1801 domain-containing protein [Flocculibacter collagenilyticus]